MPELSRFYGIKIVMHNENDEKHNIPHFHASYGDYIGTFNFNGKLIVGKFPKTARKLVAKWAKLHTKELEKAWDDLCNFRTTEKILPLE
jgi:hypothetical protein